MKNPLAVNHNPSCKHNDAFRLIRYKGTGRKEILWNNRDGPAPLIIYSKDGAHQLNRDKTYKEPRRRNHTLEVGELYFANTTKRRAKFLAKKIVYGRWDNPRYPLYNQYENKKEAIFMIYKSMYGEGNQFTILKHGKNKITFMTKQFKHFISNNTVVPS